MLRLPLAVALAAVLSGCMTAEDHAAAVIAADDAECQSYGGQPWTPAYIRCREAIFQQRQAIAAHLAGVSLAEGPFPIVETAPEPLVIHSRY